MYPKTPRMIKIDPREIQALVKELEILVEKEQEKAMEYCVPKQVLDGIFRKAKSLNRAGA